MCQGHSIWMALLDWLFLLFQLKPLLLISTAYPFQNLSYGHTCCVSLRIIKYQIILLSQNIRLRWKGVLYFTKPNPQLFDTYVSMFIFLKSWPSISFHWNVIRKSSGVMSLALKRSRGLWEFAKQLSLVRLGLDPKSPPSLLNIISLWLKKENKHTRSTFLGAMWKTKIG